jgi:hypothetical protein
MHLARTYVSSVLGKHECQILKANVYQISRFVEIMVIPFQNGAFLFFFIQGFAMHLRDFSLLFVWFYAVFSLRMKGG